MSDYSAVLADAQKIRTSKPARKVIVPGIVLVKDDVQDFFAPLARNAIHHDGCSAYIVVGGKTLRLTLERL